MKYISKKRNDNNEIITESNKTLDFFYNTLFGRFLLKMAVTKLSNNIVRLYMKSFFSVPKIKKFIKKNNIDMKEYEEKKYSSFNDFFTRKIISSARLIDKNYSSLISPSDSKLTVYTINPGLTLNIKNSVYSIDSLVNTFIMNEYVGGYALVFRLDVTDYHRYCYIDSGTKNENTHIKGIYHTVQPISLNKYNFYKTNSREYTTLTTNNFDKVIYVEVGAMCIGRIHNNHESYSYEKGEEKGYFEFGGSTIVLLIKKDVVNIDDDILSNSKNNIETIVKYGEKIGIKK